VKALKLESFFFFRRQSLLTVNFFGCMPLMLAQPLCITYFFEHVKSMEKRAYHGIFLLLVLRQ